ncbi:hypothetical protein P152DRAFT_8947 [Eremomyces bilateralis CBS 781.70]|uniref:Uncharacterized protein n=1 Tax=Eremomyces bilateralis CBS 781.70 TaxID=1392243 RepID=A0A6G1GGD5_9PEZI|nr:uncharacterized protein P152DRAFT_8947 [Eremomyces bilateralis CBS 781.70]KAF1817128.1 hypothetical protein P152DRAFT_8947 [Eremomyces bilateralis CBS 781.70]
MQALSGNVARRSARVAEIRGAKATPQAANASRRNNLGVAGSSLRRCQGLRPRRSQASGARATRPRATDHRDDNDSDDVKAHEMQARSPLIEYIREEVEVEEENKEEEEVEEEEKIEEEEEESYGLNPNQPQLNRYFIPRRLVPGYESSTDYDESSMYTDWDCDERGPDMPLDPDDPPNPDDPPRLDATSGPELMIINEGFMGPDLPVPAIEPRDATEDLIASRAGSCRTHQFRLSNTDEEWVTIPRRSARLANRQNQHEENDENHDPRRSRQRPPKGSDDPETMLDRLLDTRVQARTTQRTLESTLIDIRHALTEIQALRQAVAERRRGDSDSSVVTRSNGAPVPQLGSVLDSLDAEGLRSGLRTLSGILRRRPFWDLGASVRARRRAVSWPGVRRTRLGDGAVGRGSFSFSFRNLHAIRWRRSGGGVRGARRRAASSASMDLRLVQRLEEAIQGTREGVNNGVYEVD